jgi:hypothetical protein
MDENGNGNRSQDEQLPSQRESPTSRHAEAMYRQWANRDRKALRAALGLTTAYGGTRILAWSVRFVAVIQLLVALWVAISIGGRHGGVIVGQIIFTGAVGMLFMFVIAQVLVLSADRADAQLEMLQDRPVAEAHRADSE